MRRTTRRRLGAGLSYLVLGVITLVTCFPLLWAVLTSVRPNEEMLRAQLWPTQVTGAHYAALLAGRAMYFEAGSGYSASTAPSQHFVAWFVNSVTVSVATTAISVAVSTLAAYSFTRFRFRGQAVVPYFSLLGYMVPSIILVFPLFIVMTNLGLTDSLWSLTLGYVSTTLPFCMWLLWAFFRGIPVELEEAALIDGASRLRVFREIVLPSALPGIIAAAIFSMIVSWNDYLFARVFMNTVEHYPLTVGVMLFFEGVHVDWGLMMASAVLMTVPMAILFMLLQRHLVAGFGAGAVKG